MNEIPFGTRSRAERICDLVLAHLTRPLVATWPGGDGLLMSDILADFLSNGEPAPSGAQLLARHPELELKLEAFFNHATLSSDSTTR